MKIFENIFSLAFFIQTSSSSSFFTYSLSDFFFLLSFHFNNIESRERDIERVEMKREEERIAMKKGETVERDEEEI